MLTLHRYNAYENNVRDIIAGGVSIDTGVPFDVAEVDKNLDLTFEEHFTFQNVKSRAVANSTISTDVGNIIYNALGESMSNSNGGWQPHVTTARKQTITQLLSELMARELARA